MKYLTPSVLLVFLATFTAVEKPGEPVKRRPMNFGLFKVFDKLSEDRHEGLHFLLNHMPERDLRQLSPQFVIDNINYSYEAREQTDWAQKVPTAMFYEYVLPYANIYERRDNWRPKFFKELTPLIKDCKSIKEAADKLNREIFKKYSVKYNTKRSKPVMSPFETIDEGMATCTGLSIMLVAACRSVGIPARLVGTPMWMSKNGNHTWVEIWDGEWFFLGAAEPDKSKDLNKGWFVGKASKARSDLWMHRIYAVSYKKTTQHYPILWDLNIKYISAIDVSKRYQKYLSAGDKSLSILRLKVWNKKAGARVKVKVKLLNSDNKKTIAQGRSKGPNADMNDVLEFKFRKRKNMTLVIFDDSGQEIFKKDVSSKDLNGRRLEIYIKSPH
jgi:hypothetical protein